MATSSAQSPSQGTKGARRREWSPRMWLGMNLGAWLDLLAKNRFAFGWRQLPGVAVITLLTAFNSALGLLQRLLYGRGIARTEFKRPPIFILGHWRSGTTLLHEYLSLDERHTCPTTYECLVPHHFLISQRFVQTWLWFLLPKQRPMDNMAFGWDRPQEEEFALANLGVPSPYLTIAFPNHGAACEDYLSLATVSGEPREQWKRALTRLLKGILYHFPEKRLVLKSPTHTARIKVLLEMFPEARFIHIVRDPVTVYASTVNLWKSLYRRHALQTPTFDGLDERVYRTFVEMYEQFDEDRSLVDSSRFHEVRYEDLVRDPIGRLRAIYDDLDLGEFEKLLPALREYLDATADYQTNRYEVSPDTRDQVRRRWASFIQKYGYDAEPAAVGIGLPLS